MPIFAKRIIKNNIYMDCLAFKRKIVRSRSFRADVKTKKDALINYSKSLSGKTTVGKYDYHWLWESADSKYKVGVGKFGKEYYLNTIKWQDGHKANNPNDMRPVVYVNGKELDFDSSFDHIFRFFQEVSKIDEKALNILGCLMYRNAYLEDHKLENGVYKYCPPQEAIDYLNKTIPEYDGISIEAYLHYMEAIAWNEDVKYSTLGYDINTGIGRQNNMLTYAHIISIFLGVGSIAKLCSQFSRPPVGVSAIPQNIAIKAFPDLNIY